MTRLLLLADLHFGYHREALVEALLARVNAAGPDLVLVAGDLTHRGRGWQYDRAADFLARLGAPWMAVPGNHDLSLTNPARRLARPWRHWRRAIGRETSPVRRAGGVRVFGLNSTDRLAWQRGILPRPWVDAVLARVDPARIAVLMLHHPLAHLPGVDKELMAGARPALAALEAGPAPVVAVTGHLHAWSAGAFLDGRPRRVLQVQAGTALCRRPSDRQNEYAVLEIDGDRLAIERHVAPMQRTGFFPPERLCFSAEGGFWRRLD